MSCQLKTNGQGKRAGHDWTLEYERHKDRLCWFVFCNDISLCGTTMFVDTDCKNPVFHFVSSVDEWLYWYDIGRQ